MDQNQKYFFMSYNYFKSKCSHLGSETADLTHLSRIVLAQASYRKVIIKQSYHRVIIKHLPILQAHPCLKLVGMLERCVQDTAVQYIYSAVIQCKQIKRSVCFINQKAPSCSAKGKENKTQEQRARGRVAMATVNSSLFPAAGRNFS